MDPAVSAALDQEYGEKGGQNSWSILILSHCAGYDGRVNPGEPRSDDSPLAGSG